MDKLKNTALLIVSILSLNISAQLELDSDASHAITYEVRNDSVLIYVDVYNDLTIDIDSDGDLDLADDYVYLLFDLNSNGSIDFGGSQIDLFFTYDSTQTSNVCSGHILNPSTISVCEGSTGGNASVELKATANNITPHLFYTFSIPKAELDFNSSNSLCGRISAKIHTGGDLLEDEVTFPTYSGSDEYFVEPFNSIQLYPEAQIILPNGEIAPNNDPVAVCVGDTLSVYNGYPNFHWSGLSQEFFQPVLNIDTEEYFFKITDANDDNCVYTDTVKVQLLDNKLCEGAYKFPNIITPNNDGYNDFFQLMIGQDLLNQDWKGSKLKVYNRWGAKVHESPNNAYPYWDIRKENGSLVAAGTYFYTYSTPGENTQTINGFFNVLHDE